MSRSATKAAPKIVHVIARIQFKADEKKVAYRVRSSDGTQEYTTYLYAGKATSCDCPARKPCYHMIQLEQREAERAEAIEIGKRLEAELVLHQANTYAAAIEQQEEEADESEVLWKGMSREEKRVAEAYYRLAVCP